MQHVWLVILHDEHGECGWICPRCQQVRQHRPELRMATKHCGEWVFMESRRVEGI